MKSQTNTSNLVKRFLQIYSQYNNNADIAENESTTAKSIQLMEQQQYDDNQPTNISLQMNSFTVNDPESDHPHHEDHSLECLCLNCRYMRNKNSRAKSACTIRSQDPILYNLFGPKSKSSPYPIPYDTLSDSGITRLKRNIPMDNVWAWDTRYIGYQRPESPWLPSGKLSHLYLKKAKYYDLQYAPDGIQKSPLRKDIMKMLKSPRYTVIDKYTKLVDNNWLFEPRELINECFPDDICMPHCFLTDCKKLTETPLSKTTPSSSNKLSPSFVSLSPRLKVTADVLSDNEKNLTESSTQIEPTFSTSTSGDLSTIKRRAKFILPVLNPPPILSKEKSVHLMHRQCCQRVIAFNDADGIFYPGLVQRYLSSKLCVIRFRKNGVLAEVPTALTLPVVDMSHNQALIDGDTVLVRVKNMNSLCECWVPGRVQGGFLGYPDPRYPLRHRYEVVLFSGAKHVFRRRDILKINPDFHASIIKYITFKQSGTADSLPITETQEIKMSLKSKLPQKRKQQLAPSKISKLPIDSTKIQKIEETRRPKDLPSVDKELPRLTYTPKQKPKDMKPILPKKLPEPTDSRIKQFHRTIPSVSFTPNISKPSNIGVKPPVSTSPKISVKPTPRQVVVTPREIDKNKVMSTPFAKPTGKSQIKPKSTLKSTPQYTRETKMKQGDHTKISGTVQARQYLRDKDAKFATASKINEISRETLSDLKSPISSTPETVIIQTADASKLTEHTLKIDLEANESLIPISDSNMERTIIPTEEDGSPLEDRYDTHLPEISIATVEKTIDNKNLVKQLYDEQIAEPIEQAEQLEGSVSPVISDSQHDVSRQTVEYTTLDSDINQQLTKVSDEENIEVAYAGQDLQEYEVGSGEEKVKVVDHERDLQDYQIEIIDKKASTFKTFSTSDASDKASEKTVSGYDNGVGVVLVDNEVKKADDDYRINVDSTILSPESSKRSTPLTPVLGATPKHEEVDEGDQLAKGVYSENQLPQMSPFKEHSLRSFVLTTVSTSPDITTEHEGKSLFTPLEGDKSQYGLNVIAGSSQPTDLPTSGPTTQSKEDYNLTDEYTHLKHISPTESVEQSRVKPSGTGITTTTTATDQPSLIKISPSSITKSELPEKSKLILDSLTLSIRSNITLTDELSKSTSCLTSKQLFNIPLTDFRLSHQSYAEPNSEPIVIRIKHTIHSKSSLYTPRIENFKCQKRVLTSFRSTPNLLLKRDVTWNTKNTDNCTIHYLPSPESRQKSECISASTSLDTLKSYYSQNDLCLTDPMKLTIHRHLNVKTPPLKKYEKVSDDKYTSAYEQPMPGYSNSPSPVCETSSTAIIAVNSHVTHSDFDISSRVNSQLSISPKNVADSNVSGSFCPQSIDSVQCNDILESALFNNDKMDNERFITYSLNNNELSAVGRLNTSNNFIQFKQNNTENLIKNIELNDEYTYVPMDSQDLDIGQLIESSNELLCQNRSSDTSCERIIWENSAELTGKESVKYMGPNNTPFSYSSSSLDIHIDNKQDNVDNDTSVLFNDWHKESATTTMYKCHNFSRNKLFRQSSPAYYFNTSPERPVTMETPDIDFINSSKSDLSRNSQSGIKFSEVLFEIPQDINNGSKFKKYELDGISQKCLSKQRNTNYFLLYTDNHVHQPNLETTIHLKQA
ncbi:unnamed protein product [Trichobilharzia szidati]|nr:unnamed protein product [Trichobilharzia szidati]